MSNRPATSKYRASKFTENFDRPSGNQADIDRVNAHTGMYARSVVSQGLLASRPRVWPWSSQKLRRGSTIHNIAPSRGTHNLPASRSEAWPWSSKKSRERTTSPSPPSVRSSPGPGRASQQRQASPPRYEVRRYMGMALPAPPQTPTAPRVQPAASPAVFSRSTPAQALPRTVVEEVDLKNPQNRPLGFADLPGDPRWVRRIQQRGAHNKKARGD